MFIASFKVPKPITFPTCNIQNYCDCVNRWTVLHHSSDHGHKKITEYLLSHGADVDIKTDGKDTALILAAKGRNFEVVQVLVGQRSNINHRGSNGFVP